MTEIIKTERLYIKPFCDKDKESLFELLLDEKIKKSYMIPDFQSPEALNKMANTFISLSPSPDRFVRGIYANGVLIGFINDVEIKDGCIELGYVIRHTHWNMG